MIPVFKNPQILLKCPDMGLRSAFIGTIEKIYHGKQDSVHQQIYHFTIGRDVCDLMINFEDLDHQATVILVLNHEYNETLVKTERPCVFCQITPEKVKPKIIDNIHLISFDKIAHGTVQALLTYLIIYNDCVPFDLHLRKPMIPYTLDLLKRAFRSFDFNCEGTICLSDFSEIHRQIFGSNLSSEDMSSIFQVLNEGSEPLWIETLRSRNISFPDLCILMQHLINQGYGHIVYEFIKFSPFHLFLDQNYPYMFNGPTKKLNAYGQKFILGLYHDFNGVPTKEQIEDLFRLSGGTPHRFANMKHFSEKDWVAAWNDWALLEPGNAAKQMLAIGFPVEKINEAFGCESKSAGSTVAAITASVGLTAAAALGATLLIFHSRK